MYPSGKRIKAYKAQGSTTFFSVHRKKFMGYQETPVFKICLLVK